MAFRAYESYKSVDLAVEKNSSIFVESVFYHKRIPDSQA